MYVCIGLFIYDICACLFICISVCKYRCGRCTYVYMCRYGGCVGYVWMHVGHVWCILRVCMYVCMYVCMHVSAGMTQHTYRGKDTTSGPAPYSPPWFFLRQSPSLHQNAWPISFWEFSRPAKALHYSCTLSFQLCMGSFHICPLARMASSFFTEPAPLLPPAF